MSGQGRAVRAARFVSAGCCRRCVLITRERRPSLSDLLDSIAIILQADFSGRTLKNTT